MAYLKLLLTTVVFANLALHAEAHTTCGDQTFACDGSENRCSPDGKKCVCAAGMAGVGGLGCASEEYFRFCHLTNDPEGKNFANQPEHPVDIPYPCQFRLASFQVDKTGFTCEVAVDAASVRHNGKMFIKSFLATFIIEKGSWKETLELRASAYVDAAGDYVYELGRKVGGNWVVTNDMVDLSDLQTFDKLGFSGRLDVNAVYKRAELSMSQCALGVYFRPMDFIKDTAEYLPGIAVSVLEDKNSHTVTYLDKNLPFCASDKTDFLDPLLGTFAFSKYQGALMFRAVQGSNTLPQTLPDVNAASCRATALTIDTCMKTGGSWIDNAAFTCNRFLLSREFVKCYSKDADSADLMQFFGYCAGCFCSNSQAACDKMNQKLQETGCSVQ